LIDAVKAGDREAVHALLAQHVAVNSAGPDGATAIQWASYRDDIETADALIQSGANVKAANDYGVTPLWLACGNGSVSMIDHLLKAGAQPNDAALMKCVHTGRLESARALLSHGASVNSREPREQQTALMWSLSDGHTNIARLLIEHGADVNAHSKSGFTPLMFAAQQGDLGGAKALLAAGARVNEATAHGDTPLLVASASGQEALSIFLLEQGADAKAADENGFTALHYSLMRGLALICRIRMLKFKTYLDRPNMDALVQALLAHGADPNARIQKGVRADPLSIGDKIFRVTATDPPPGSGSPVGATAFLMAAITYDTKAMRALVSAGANPGLTTEDGVTALMMAAGLTRWRSAGDRLPAEEETRALEAVSLAVELGIDVNAAEHLGMTALHGAAFNGSDQIVRLLVEKGANLNARDSSGQTPLDKAENIKPAGSVNRNLFPVVGWKSTADLLRQLGAVQ
jgi:ankyrin repeat protein